MEEIIEKIKELMAQVDPTLNLEDGSPFDTVVLQYIRDQFGVGDLELDIADMISRRISQFDETISVSAGSAVHELLIKPLSAIMQVPRIEVQRIKNNQDLNNLDSMTDAEVDRRFSNLFVERRVGDVAVGTVRAYFTNPVPVRTNLTNRAVASSGLAFYPDGAYEATQNQVAANRQDGLFYVDIPYVAEAAGSQYNVESNEIVTIENMPGLVRATNLNRFVGGAPRETNRGLFDRSKKSIAERSLSSRNSIITILTEKFPNQLLAVFPIGFGDIEMSRDAFVVKPSVNTSGIVLLVLAQTGIGGVGPYDLGYDDIDQSSLRVYSGTTLLTQGTDYTFNQAVVAGANDSVTLITLPNPADSIVIYGIRLSGYAPLVQYIPGSIEVPPLFPAPAQDQTVHVGGKADIYVKTSTLSTDSLIVEQLGWFVVFRADDGILEEDPPASGIWYFRTDRNLSIAIMGVLPGDIVDVIEQDSYGNPTVLDGMSFKIEKIDAVNNRYLLDGGPAVPLTGVDVRIRMKEDRALPLERLVAVDNFGDPVFLNSSGERSTEYQQSVFIPVAPSMGFLNRDSSKPDFPDTFQDALPINYVQPATLQRNVFINGNTTSFVDNRQVSGMVYALAEENLASGNIDVPWVRLTQVSMLDPLTLEVIENQYLRNIYPADIRTVDVSGGVDGDITNPGKESAGKLRIYFENPVTVLMYGPNYGDMVTRFVHRTVREVSRGVFVTCNLVYKLNTHGPAGGPAVLVLPSDYTKENGLWYFDVIVIGDSTESEREDAKPVPKSYLNLGDGAEMFVGTFGLTDELYHRIDELEFEEAGGASPRTLAGPDVPVDGSHPYATYTASTAGDIATISGVSNPELLLNLVQVGDILRVLAPSTVNFRQGVVSGITVDVNAAPNDNEVVSSIDLMAAGVQIGDIVSVNGSPAAYVTGFATSVVNNDTMILDTVVPGAPLVGTTLTYVRKWDVVSTHTVLEVISSSTLRLDNVVTPLVGESFAILDTSGQFRLRAPDTRLGLYPQDDGVPGNDPNGSFRAEGYWFDTRDPYERSMPSGEYSFTIRELTLFRYTVGADTRYAPNLRPVGSEINLIAPTVLVEGRGRDNFTFYSGQRLGVVGATYELAVGTGLVWPTDIDGTSVNVDLLSNSVDPKRIRVRVPDTFGYRELVQQPAGAPVAGYYVLQKGAGTGGVDRIVIHPTDQAACSVPAPGKITYLSEIRSFTLIDVGPGTPVLTVTDGALILETDLPATAEDIAQIINDLSVHYYSTVGADDQGGNIAASASVFSDTGAAVTFGASSLTDGVTDFSASGVLPGHVLQVTNSASNDGFYVVAGVSPDGLTVYLTTALTAGVDNIDYVFYAPYVNPTTAGNSLGENFLSRQMLGRALKLEYEWSPSALEAQTFVSSSSTRSINQDLFVRHGIPVFANIDMTVNSTVTDVDTLTADINDYIMLLNQQALRTSELVRLPVVTDHVPLPLSVNGLVHLENRRFKTYRGIDGFEPRRVEVVIPDTILVTVNA